VSDNAEMFGREKRYPSISREMVVSKIGCGPNYYPYMLESQYPHVLENVVKLWNSPEGERYLNDLLNPSSSGGRFERAGFPDKVWDEIYYLLDLYRKYQSEREAREEIRAVNAAKPQTGLMGSLFKAFGKDRNGRK
jgi:hypothetical protein